MTPRMPDLNNKKSKTISPISRGRRIMDHLPPEVIYRIADRLPLKGLVRFRCARKEWYTDPFLKTCMAKFIEKPTVVSLDIDSRRCDPDRKPRFEVDIDRNFVSSSIPQLAKFIENASIPQLARDMRAAVMGTCNGMVCFFQDDSPGFLVLVNPLLEEVVSLSTLPPPEPKGYPTKPRHNLREDGWVSCGLGLDHASGVYKLVVFTYRAIWVFELCTRLWREISRPWNWITFDPPIGIGVFLDGTLYWQHSSHDILSFDVAKEDFDKLSCPIRSSTLFDFGGNLGVAGYNRSPGHIIEIWEHNLHSKGWTNKYNIEAALLAVKGAGWRDLGISDVFDIVGVQNGMILFRIEKTMYSYDPRSRKLKCIHPEGYATEFYCLKGSLVSLARFNPREL